MKTALILATALLADGCDEREPSAEVKDQKAVEEQQEQYQISQPIPKFDYSLERDITIQLYQARNENVATHTVWRSEMGTIEGDCASIGFPLPYDTSLTNPLQAMWQTYQGVSAAVIEQPEPNGIFASKNSTATWVRCVTPDGHEVPVYIESKVTTYPYPVTVDYETNRAVRDGNSVPSVTIEKRSK